MKIKPVNKGGVIVELGPKEEQIPATDTALPAFQLRKILVPVDFSKSSEKALQYAIRFSQQFHAEVILLHVLELYPIVPETGAMEVEPLQGAWEDLRLFQRLVPESVSSLVFVRKGDVCAEILEAAREMDVDLIITSTHGRTGVDHFLFGSTAEKIVRRASCPVLIVREREHEFIAGFQENIHTSANE